MHLKLYFTLHQISKNTLSFCPDRIILSRKKSKLTWTKFFSSLTKILCPMLKSSCLLVKRRRNDFFSQAERWGIKSFLDFLWFFSFKSIYIIKTGLGLSVCLSVCPSKQIFLFWLWMDFQPKHIIGILMWQWNSKNCFQMI